MKKMVVFFLLAVTFVIANEPPPSLVEVKSIQKEMTQNTQTYLGTIYFEETSSVATEVSGKVKDVLVDAGDRVKKGELIATLDSEIVELSIKSSMAKKRSLEAKIKSSQKDLDRTKSLYEKGSVSEKSFDDIRFGLESLNAELQSLESEIEKLRLDLEKRKIYSPFQGIVVEKLISVGEWVNTGSGVAQIAKDDFIDIISNIPNKEARSLEIGSVVGVEIEGVSFEGKIEAVLPKGDPATRTFPVKISLKNSNRFLEGMESKVSLPKNSKKEAFLIPRDAVVNFMGKNVIFFVSDNKANPMPIEIDGYSGKDVITTTSTLKDGMQIVVQGQERLRPDSTVNIVNKKAQD